MSYGDWVRVSDYESKLEMGPGNGVIRFINNGPGSMELRFVAMNNSASMAHWRFLFNSTGGLEVQQSPDDSYTAAKNVLSIAGGDVNVVIDQYGLAQDSQRTDKLSRVAFRNSDGTQVLGQVTCGPSPLNGNQPALYFSAIDPSGTLKPCMVIGPRDGMTASQTDANDNPIAFWVGGGWHRLRRQTLSGVQVATLT